MANKPFTALTTAEANRVEKQLRLESKLSQDPEKEVLLHFIEAIHNHPAGLDFLVGNPNITHVLFKKPKKLNTSARMQVYDYDHSHIKQFFTSCLLSELLETVGSEFQTNKFTRLFELVKFHRFLPDAVVLDIIKRIHARLDYIQSKLDARLESASQDIHDLKSMVIYLGDEPLKARWTKMRVVGIQVTLADDETGGSTLNWINNYFDALFDTTPKTEFEREKRGELLRGCNCAMGFIVLMFAFFGIVIWIFTATYKSSKVKKPELKAIESTTWDLPKELATFRYDKFTTIYDIKRPETNSDKLGNDFLSGKIPSVLANAFIVNTTTSDMIVFSTSWNRSMTILKPTSKYIRAGDSIRWSSFLGTRLYIGKRPKLIIQQNSDNLALKFRFMEINRNARKLVRKEFYFKGTLTVRDSLGSFYLDATDTLELSSDHNTTE
ncbi:hypothetical protein GCM10011344_42240 [Dokdonia pacifica]|uniref:Uncharacterized protein n=1 Tax=Dokdonia pacifica TaxID=1627892 RepID=A0A239DLJ9_9FLAO|nr:hypothetical protein [Dokdonia pacifica]GGG36922.1 hypothetical protein GCM10011344_42240 [Dokdonia pacifica]SNS33079.1 hypothetical protein SAMN06265376_11173 [Dokdonia pacifica]